MIDKWDISQVNLDITRETKYEVAVLPTSAIEPHNTHLPYGQDYLLCNLVAKRICKEAWEKGARALYLPGLPYGVDCNLMDFPLAIHVSQQTLNAMVQDIIVSLKQNGIRKILLLNGHGGNSFKSFVRQIQCDHDIHLFTCDWWLAGLDRADEFFTEPGDHAGQLETSCCMATYPELVGDIVPNTGYDKPFRFDALNEGWMKTSRNFANLNNECAAGDPAGSTAEKGEAYLDMVCNRLTKFLVELSNEPIDETFPHIKN